MLAKTTVLFSTQSEALELRKRLAQEQGNALLGMNVTTPRAFLEELWDVWGSGERLITSSQRKMLIKMLLEEQDSWVASAGTVDLLFDFIRDQLLSLTPEFIASNEATFTPTDQEIVDFVSRYAEALEAQGLIEEAQALAKVQPFLDLEQTVIRTRKQLPAYYERVLHAVSKQVVFMNPQIGEEDAAYEQDILAVLGNKNVLFLKPAGRSASASLVWKALHERSNLKKVAITSPDPLMLFNQMKDVLTANGYAVSLKTNRAFKETFFGQAYCAIATIFGVEGRVSAGAIIDAALSYLASPYAQILAHDRQKILKIVLSDRTLDAEAIARLLQGVSPSFDLFVQLLEETDADVLFPYFDQLLFQPQLGLSSEETACEHAILSQTRAVYQELCSLCGSPADFFDLVCSLSVPASVSVAPQASVPACVDSKEESAVPCKDSSDMKVENEGSSECVLPAFEEDRDLALRQILISTLEDVSALPQTCCDAVIMTSLDAVHYPGAQKRSTLSEFARRYGLPLGEERREILFKQFMRACAVPEKQVIFERAAYDRDGKDIYSAFFLEELLNEMNLQGMPIMIEESGEEHFDDSARLISAEEVMRVDREPLQARGALPEQARTELLSYRADAQGSLCPVISPSSLEVYRSCPYKWFVSRKLHLEDLGEEFGGREIGTFVHELYQDFYNQWAQLGHTRVTASTNTDAKKLFSELLDIHLAQQETLEPGNRLVAVGESERVRLEHLKQHLIQNFSFQYQLFPGYDVLGHEISFTPEDQIVYGGAILQGRIDRVDKDGQGHAIVIDYKGSLGSEYTAGINSDAIQEEFVAPEKVQTLMYAQALRRKDPALELRGAVYMSYKADTGKDLIRGSVAETLFDEIALFTTKNNVVQMSFESYLDMVEADLARTIKRMESGDIAPNPINARACAYCPVLHCERRLS